MEIDELEEDYSIEIKSETPNENKKKPFKNNKKGKKLHTIESKIEILKFAKENSVKEAMLKYGIPYTTLHDWKKNEDKFLNLPDKKLNKKTLHKGNSILNPELEKKLVTFIEFNRKLSNPITIWALLLKMLEYNPERKKKLLKSNMQLIYRFLQRNNFTFRAQSQIGHMMTILSVKI